MAHQHTHQDAFLADTVQGLRASRLTFFALLAAAVGEAVVVYFTDSAGLLADTLHGGSNAATTVPLWIAFALGKRRANQRYPYGYSRMEDLAGLIILGFIAISAVVVGYQSVDKLINREEPHNLALGMAAGAATFIVAELVAQYRVRVGKQIGSAALVADGHHARADGLGSLAVVFGLIAAAIGFPIGDALVGLGITLLIVYILIREAGPAVISRAVDRMDPSLLQQVNEAALAIPGVRRVYDVRARWLGHSLIAELSVGVNPNISVSEGHRLSQEVEHKLLHDISKLQRCLVHIEPFPDDGALVHDITGHHFVSKTDETHDHDREHAHKKE
ncbi:MAG: cation transporter [SAR202 cluster bacterium]|nr:cation transporter [SAR202 cluster bacterium]